MIGTMHWGVIVPPTIAFLSMVGSLIGWWRSRKAKAAAADHERRAVEAAEAAAGHEARSADAAERSAAAAEAQQQREEQRRTTLDADPWSLDPIPNDPDAYLINRSQTPKYGVTVSGFKIDGAPLRFDKIGAGKRVEISVHRIMHPDDTVNVTWHQQEDCTDTEQHSTETVPSRI